MAYNDRVRILIILPILTLLLISVAACGGDSADRTYERSGSNQPDAEPDGTLIAFLGDSLTAGLGLAGDGPFPTIAGELLRKQGLAVRIVNAGVSGDTTAGGVTRLPWVMRQRPDILIIGLGANDGMRGLPLEMTERNLRALVRDARGGGAAVLLLGMHIPPSYGPVYAADFAAIYPRVARDLDVELAAAFLDGVGGRPSMNLPDGLHPNGAGHRRLAANIVPLLERLIGELPAPAGGSDDAAVRTK